MQTVDQYGESEDEEEQYGEDGDESFSDADDDDYDESERARMNGAGPAHPAYTGEAPSSPGRAGAVHVEANARRLPPSLTPDATPAGAPPSPFLQQGVTSGTRMGGPPLAKGAKAQGWREWLQQKRAQTRPAPEAPDDGGVQQRI